MIYYGSDGKEYSLIEADDNSFTGGEGKVYFVAEEDTLMAKIFSERNLREYGVQLHKHIKWLSEQSYLEDFEGFKIAWPKDLLFNEKPQHGMNERTSFCGYIMQKIDHICSLDTALTDEGIIGKQATLKDKIQIAYNYASFVNAFHKEGLIIGDFNLNNVLLTKHGNQYTISFIDCGGFSSSYEQLNFGARIWQADWPEAPERKLKICNEHTVESDLFYLAVVMFRILVFNGNPFEAYSDYDDIDVDDNLSNGICLYISNYENYYLPDYFPKPGFIPDDIMELFDKSFSYTKENITQRMITRATAQDWVDTLSKYNPAVYKGKYIQCKRNKQHFFFSHLSECPLCNPESVSDQTYETRLKNKSFINKDNDQVKIIDRGNKLTDNKYEDLGKEPIATLCDILAEQMVVGLSRGENDYYFDIINPTQDVELTKKGISKVESFFKIDDLNDPQVTKIKNTLIKALNEKETKLINDEIRRRTLKMREKVDTDGLRQSTKDYKIITNDKYWQMFCGFMSLMVLLGVTTLLIVTMVNLSVFESFISNLWIAIPITAIIYATSNYISDVKKWNGEIKDDLKWWKISDRIIQSKWSTSGVIGVLMTIVPASIAMFLQQYFRDVNSLGSAKNINIGRIMIFSVYLGLFFQIIHEISNLDDYFDYSIRIRKGKIQLSPIIAVFIEILYIAAFTYAAIVTLPSYYNEISKSNSVIELDTTTDNNTIEMLDSENSIENNWGPQDRKTYSWDNLADCVTFNSIIDNPEIGDERRFVMMRKIGDNESYHRNEVSLEPGQEYEVLIYLHNNAESSMGQIGRAQNVRIRTVLPSIIIKQQTESISSYISSSNASPNEIWDSMYITSEAEAVAISYISNSAVLHNNGSSNGVKVNEDDLFSQKGALIAYWNDSWGVIPGGSNIVYLTYRIKVL